MNFDSNQFVVITPIFEDTAASNMLFTDLVAHYGNDVFVVAVDDGSVHEPITTSNLAQAGLSGIVIKLKRNVGHQRAIAVGMSYVAEHFSTVENVIVMDSDGEDNPASIKDLRQALQHPDVDIVVSERKSRVETIWFTMFYAFYKRLFRLLTGRKICFGNFIALKQSAVKRLVSMPELWTHVAGCVLASKLRVADRLLDRGQRYAGASKMNFVGLALHGFKALMVFSEDVLVRVGIICSAVAIMSLLGVVMAIILKALDFTTPGWFSIALGILLLVFLQTGALTLMSLLLTGVVKSNTPTRVDYNEYIDDVNGEQI